MSFRKTGLPSFPVPSGSLVRIEVDRAGERVGDDERRRREVVRAHLGVHAPLEVAVAAEHRRGDERPPRSMAFETASGSGPLLPMHVVQP